MVQITNLLCVFYSLSTTALELSVQDCTTLNHIVPSLYEQYCCVEDNRGKSFILSDNEHNKVQYIMCPHATPASCSSIDFFPSCSDVLTSHPTATSGYYNIIVNGIIDRVYCDLESNSCVELKELLPDSPSDYYNILIDGQNQTVFCNMLELCGDSGGWMRVGYLNMSDPSEQCPPGFKLYEENGIRACGRQSSGCQSVKFRHGIDYTQVCGRVIGYQKGWPDAFSNNLLELGQRNNIDGAYVDGVSITRGSGPRKHIWTYAASPRESIKWCPCDVGSTQTTPSFVGDDYFCETARETSGAHYPDFHADDLLWDGEQCGYIQEPCCEASIDIPWFKKVLDAPSTDFIELRVCGDQDNDNEDIPVYYYDIFVK